MYVVVIITSTNTQSSWQPKQTILQKNAMILIWAPQVLTHIHPVQSLIPLTPMIWHWHWQHLLHPGAKLQCHFKYIWSNLWFLWLQWFHVNNIYFTWEYNQHIIAVYGNNSLTHKAQRYPINYYYYLQSQWRRSRPY